MSFDGKPRSQALAAITALRAIGKREVETRLSDCALAFIVSERARYDFGDAQCRSSANRLHVRASAVEATQSKRFSDTLCRRCPCIRFIQLGTVSIDVRNGN